jgi:galactokinase
VLALRSCKTPAHTVSAVVQIQWAEVQICTSKIPFHVILSRNWPTRLLKVQDGAVLQAAKKRSQGATEEGIRYAQLNAARTAGQILARTVEHHLTEAQRESDVAEASEYKDEIKASIKKWAFQVRVQEMWALFLCGTSLAWSHCKLS